MEYYGIRPIRAWPRVERYRIRRTLPPVEFAPRGPCGVYWDAVPEQSRLEGFRSGAVDQKRATFWVHGYRPAVSQDWVGHLQAYRCQGWQGCSGAMTSAPRPALPGEISSSCPALPDTRASPGLTGLSPGHDPRVTRLNYFAQA